MNRFMRFTLFVVLLLTAVSATADANPFMEGQPSPLAAHTHSSLFPEFTHKIVAIQRQIHQAITEQITALKQGESLAGLWGLLLISFAYGVFHVLAPGHGKVIVSSYFIGHKAHWREGLWAGAMMAAGHTVTSIGIVTVLYLVMGFGQLQVLNNTTYIELFGYGLIILVGLWLLFNAVRKEPTTCCAHHHEHGHSHGHAHSHHYKPKNQGTKLFAVSSLVPCTGSMVILLFTLANNVLWAGILAVISVALGMWITVTTIGLLSIFLRHALVGDDATASPHRQKLIALMRVGAALLIIATGSVLFLGAAYSL